MTPDNVVVRVDSVKCKMARSFTLAVWCNATTQMTPHMHLPRSFIKIQWRLYCAFSGHSAESELQNCKECRPCFLLRHAIRITSPSYPSLGSGSQIAWHRNELCLYRPKFCIAPAKLLSQFVYIFTDFFTRYILRISISNKLISSCSFGSLAPHGLGSRECR